MKSTIAAVAAFASAASASLYGESTANHTCQLVPDYQSCSIFADPSKVDSCCVETFGGLLLATQFWDVYADKAIPANTWTLHGLWPDFCNGSYTQYCDLSRQYDPVPSPNTTNGLRNGTAVPAYTGPNIGTFLTPFAKYDLLAFMNKYWISNAGPNADFWGHEFSKHATCFSTFDVPCYGPQYVQHEDVVDFFETAIKYYLQKPTWEWLAKYNILPSNTTGYSLSNFENALSAESGALPYIGCSGPRYNETAAGKGTSDTRRTVISEVWYYMHVFGRPQDGTTVPVDQTGTSSCTNATGALRYYVPSNSTGSVTNSSSSSSVSIRPSSGTSVGTSVRTSVGTSVGTTSRSSSTSSSSSSSSLSTSVSTSTRATTGAAATTTSSASSSSSKPSTTSTARTTSATLGGYAPPAGYYP